MRVVSFLFLSPLFGGCRRLNPEHEWGGGGLVDSLTLSLAHESRERLGSDVTRLRTGQQQPLGPGREAGCWSPRTTFLFFFFLFIFSRMRVEPGQCVGSYCSLLQRLSGSIALSCPASYSRCCLLCPPRKSVWLSRLPPDTEPG